MAGLFNLLNRWTGAEGELYSILRPHIINMVISMSAIHLFDACMIDCTRVKGCVFVSTAQHVLKLV